MKVCTDACLFGAWTAAIITGKPERISSVLDIGSGTGLLSLMLAQKLKTPINAIEIDLPAYEQTKENFENSDWKELLNAMHGDILTLEQQTLYALVITNPPFYEKELRSPAAAVNMARHDTSLTLEALVRKVCALLKEEGYFSIMLPWHRYDSMLKIASENGLILSALLRVKQSPKHDFFRAMMLFEKTKKPQRETLIRDLTIKEIHHQYSENFIEYLKDYYLSL